MTRWPLRSRREWTELRELRYIIGGPQGGGLETTSEILSWAFARSGYGVISDREYFSNIKGRHSYIHATVSGAEVPYHLSYPVDVIAAMDAESVFSHIGDIRDGGYLIYNSDEGQSRFNAIPSMERELRDRLAAFMKAESLDGTLASVVKYLSDARRVNAIGLSYRDLLDQLQKKESVEAAQASRYISTILSGAMAALSGVSRESIEFSMRRRFRQDEIYRANMTMFDIVSSLVESKHGSPLKLEGSTLSLRKMLVASGNDTVAMAKAVAGLRFQSYYPITPAADESFTLEEYERLAGDGPTMLVYQLEDELAVINAAIGAALAGVRSAAATSGPGFDLMVEGLGWAGMNEVPVVVTYYQRGGPSTGQPTRGAQSDLLSSVFASHGEYPRVVLASGDHVEAFYDTIDAFNYAEQFQVPVIHLVDKFLANTIATFPIPDLSSVKINRGAVIKEKVPGYKRFDFTYPVSPRAPLGTNVMWYTGDEHDEYGHISEDSENRVKIMEKRMGKLEVMEKEIPEERRYSYFGDERPDLILVGWGFVKGVATKAVSELRASGKKVGYLHIRTFVPFPSRTIGSVAKDVGADRLVAVEHNYEAQAAVLTAANTGITIGKKIVKFTGRPMYANELEEAVMRVMKGENRVVLEYGA